MKAVYAFQGNGLTPDLIERGIDINYFTDIPNATVAVRTLDLVSDPSFIACLIPKHTEREIADLKRKVYRACIAHDVPLPSRCVIEARMLDVIVP